MIKNDDDDGGNSYDFMIATNLLVMIALVDII